MKNLTLYFIKRFKKLTLTIGFLLSYIIANAATEAATSTGNKDILPKNPNFLLLTTIIIILLIIIVVLGNVLVSIATASVKKSINKALTILALIGLSFLPLASFAQDAVQVTAPVENSLFSPANTGLNGDLFAILVSAIIIEVIIIAMLLMLIKKFLAPIEVVETVKEPSILDTFKKNFIDAAAPQEEEALMTDHVYDGIRELDNGMPPWLKYMFFATILFAIVYMFHYQFFKTGMLQGDEYKKEMADAEIQLEQHRAMAKNNVDESNVTFIMDAASLSEGHEVYKNNCAVCHGQLGEGNVGPNFTDDYWLHGGDAKSIFKTIKFGVVEKGMKSWQADISPLQIQLVTSYINSLHGTNPPNQKEKQGELYIDKSKADSTNVKVDSTMVKLATQKDSVK